MKGKLFSYCVLAALVALAVSTLSSGGLSLEAIRRTLANQPQESETATHRVVGFEWEMTFGMGQKLIQKLIESENVEVTAQAGLDEDIVAIRGEGKRGYLAFSDNAVTSVLGNVATFFTDRCEYDASSETWRWYFDLPRGGQEVELKLPIGNISISQGRCSTNFYLVAQNLTTGEESLVELASSMMFFGDLQEGDPIGQLVYNVHGQLDSYRVYPR